MKFTKMQGAGNDFVLVETSEERDWSKLAITICDRHFGIGADGLLLLVPSNKANFRMRVFNPDGSEADACGNGLRCLVRYVLERGLAGANPVQMQVETLSGTSKIYLDRKGKATRIKVSLGVPKFGAKDIPVVIDPGKQVDIKPILDYPVKVDGTNLLLNPVSVGNPHVVHFTSSPVADFPLSRLGPKVERHEMFPKRVNFEVARIKSQTEIEARVWERGVGETLACGSGACAIAVMSQLHGYTGKKVDITLPGGLLQVEWDGVGEVLLSGPAEIVFTGEW